MATLVVMSPNAAKAQTHANPPRVIFGSLAFAALLDVRHPISESGWTRVVLPLCPPATSNHLITTERFPLWLIIKRMWVGGLDFVRASDRDCHSAPRDDAPKSRRNSDTRRDEQPITIPGRWDEWKEIEIGERVKSCTMIITEANDFVREVHDRMPVILEKGDFDAWLTGRGGSELLKPAANDLLQKWPVSRRVNSSRTGDEDATLIDRIELPIAVAVINHHQPERVDAGAAMTVGSLLGSPPRSAAHVAGDPK
jgi:SOS response associated peptidase (SRAP)